MMKTTTIFLLLLPLTCFADQWQPYNTDVKQEASAEHIGEPDHLLPTSAPVPGRYYCLLKCVAIPSFSSPLRVEVILSSNKTHAVVKAFTKEKEEKSWTEVGRTTLPLKIADTLYRASVNTLFETRHSRSPHGGLDGTTYQFGTFVRALGSLNGETSSPHTDAPPKHMISIGKSLYELAQGKLSAKDVHATVRRESEWIMNYLAEHAITRHTTVEKLYPPEQVDISELLKMETPTKPSTPTK
jgi:hypothetical protein